MDDLDFHYDEEAIEMVVEIENDIRQLHLPTQGQFISLINALLVVLESGWPDPTLLRHLGDAFLRLADIHGVDRRKLKLDQRIQDLRRRIDRGPSGSGTR